MKNKPVLRGQHYRGVRGIDGIATADTPAMAVVGTRIREIAARGTMGVVEGDYGLGKSFAAREAAGELRRGGANVIFWQLRRSTTPANLLKEMHNQAIGTRPVLYDADDLFDELLDAISEGKWVFFLDEADRIPPLAFEYIQDLFDHTECDCPCQCDAGPEWSCTCNCTGNCDGDLDIAFVFIGPSGTRKQIAKDFSDRIETTLVLKPWSDAEAKKYIKQIHPDLADIAKDVPHRIAELNETGRGTIRFWMKFLSRLHDYREPGQPIDDALVNSVLLHLHNASGVANS